MAVKIIRGPAGSGKSSAAIAKVLELDPVRWGREVRYVVPTVGAARQIEYRLMRASGRSGILGNVVTTFYSLAREFITRSGCAGQLISDTQKGVMLEQLVRDAELKYFSRAAEYPGFVDAVGEIIGELKLSLITPDDFEAALQRAEHDLAPHSRVKLQELARLYRRYQREILEEKGLHDREGLMWRALDVLRANGYLKQLSCLIFDGFDVMQPVQRELLSLAAEQAPEVLVTLTYDSGRPEVFQAVGETREFALSLGAEELVLEPQESASSLEHLRREIFGSGSQEHQPDDSVTMLAGGNRTIEIELVAEEIRRLVQEKGLRTSEIAVVARDVDPYRGAIERTMRLHDVPIEPAAQRLGDNAYARLMLACIDCVAQGWSRNELLRVLKADHLGSDLDSACRAEVDAKQLGILAGREKWLDRWEDSDRTHEFRTKILSALQAFEDRLKNTDGAEPCAAALRDLLKGITFRAADEELLARDSSADGVIKDILKDLVGAEQLLGRKFGSTEFLELLRDAISRATYALPSRFPDAVRLLPIGAIGGEKFRAVFVVGLLEKAFPRQIREDSFLRDSERPVLNKHLSHGLAERLPQQAAERLYFYLAAAAATEKLFLTYPLVDESAKDTLPSFYLDEVRKILGPELRSVRREVSEMVPSVESATSKTSLERAVVYALSNYAEDSCGAALQVYNAYQHDRPGIFSRIFRDCVEKDACVSDNKILSHIANSGRVYRCTELEAYAGCPFMHFCQYTLGLEAIRDEVGALDSGGLLHEVLYRLFAGLRDEYGNTLDVRGLDSEKTVAWAWEILEDELVKATRFLHLPPHEYEMQKHTLETYLRRYIAGEIKKGYESYTPIYFELEFGSRARPDRNRDPASVDEPLVIEDDSGSRLSICGKIDRVDTSENGALVIDYKLGSSTKASDFTKGITFQFLIYALAVEQLFGMKVVGAEYRQVKRWSVDGYYEQDCGIKQGKKALPPEEFREKLSQCRELVLQIAEDIRSGRIAVEPKSCPDYCSFRGVCRTDAYKQAVLAAAGLAGAEGEEVEA